MFFIQFNIQNMTGAAAAVFRFIGTLSTALSAFKLSGILEQKVYNYYICFHNFILLYKI